MSHSRQFIPLIWTYKQDLNYLFYRVVQNNITCSMKVRIARAGVAPNVGCNKPFDPSNPGSDLNPMNKTHNMYSVKCGITNQGGVVHYNSSALKTKICTTLHWK